MVVSSERKAFCEVPPCEILLPIDWNTDDGQYREFRYGTVDFMVEAPTITAKESDLT